jgi:low affinity Fe/Cu permease
MATPAEIFRRWAYRSSEMLGSVGAFFAAVALVVGWAVAGPVFHYSDSWELFINTATTIVTFLMVFLIQNSQNRDVKALHLKLDELIRAQRGARDRLMRLESLTDEELSSLQAEFERLRALAAERARPAGAPPGGS